MQQKLFKGCNEFNDGRNVQGGTRNSNVNSNIINCRISCIHFRIFGKFLKISLGDVNLKIKINLVVSNYFMCKSARRRKSPQFDSYLRRTVLKNVLTYLLKL